MRLPPGTPVLERLLHRREISPSGCWLWTGALSDGYGVIRITEAPHERRNAYVHRLALEVILGIRPAPGAEVCHTCDTPACFRPDHLFVGTHWMNMLDFTQKGLRKPAVGERASHAKLTAAQVVEIRRALAEGAGVRELGRRYDVPHSSIANILHRRSWTHVP
jgi:hypothetical protein